jgi:hypothetical protein
MLQTLKNYNNREAALILAGLSRQLLPDELLEPTLDEAPINSETHQRVLAEVYRKLRLTAEDKSEESQARVINYIGKEMSRVALAGSDLHAVENRVGQQGNLRPEAYKVILTSRDEEYFYKYGLHRGQIKATVNEADDFQHLLPGLFGPVDNNVSLFVKIYPNGDDPFTILVQAERAGATVKVQHAFKVYDSDVNLDYVREPLDLLLVFVEKYGFQVTVGDESGKFVMYKSIPHDVRKQGNDFFHAHTGSADFRSGFHVMSTRNSVEVAVGYVINETAYLSDLKRHEYLVRK